MKTLFEQPAVEEITRRIHKLTPTTQKQWGKMNVSQMLAHCAAAMETATGTTKLPRMFIGRILGPIAKPNFINEKPFARNTPTAKEFIIKNDMGFEREKERLLGLIKQFASGGPENCTSHPHAFFGRLTPVEWSTGMYKHLDHHLRQFGC